MTHTARAGVLGSLDPRRHRDADLAGAADPRPSRLPDVPRFDRVSDTGTGRRSAAPADLAAATDTADFPEDAGDRRTAFGVLLGIIEVLEAAFAWPAQQEYIDAVEAGNSTYDVFTPYDVAGLSWFLAMIGAYVATGVWLHRAHVQARAIDPRIRPSRSSGWAWGGWIVPVVNLWFPFQVVRDAWVRRLDGDGAALRGWWWATWLLAGLSTGVTSFLITDDTSALSGLAPVESIDAVLNLIALALWLAIVWKITRAQDRALRTP